ncbi:MAG: hypothetical protein OWR52_03750 [Acidibacillus sp.]|nr:hypothetical protein [Acidibacillus sp.]
MFRTARRGRGAWITPVQIAQTDERKAFVGGSLPRAKKHALLLIRSYRVPRWMPRSNRPVFRRPIPIPSGLRGKAPPDPIFSGSQVRGNPDAGRTLSQTTRHSRSKNECERERYSAGLLRRTATVARLLLDLTLDR